MTQELRKLRKLAERATPGYWSYAGCEYADNGGTFETIEAETDTVIGEYSLSEKDARYIAAANPAAILALLDRVEKAEKDAERLLPLLKQARSVVDGSYSEEYDQGFEEIVSAALFTEIQAMEASK